MHDTMFFMKLRVLLCGWRWTHHRRASWLKAQLRRARHRMSRLARTVHTSSSRLTQYSAPSTQHFLLEPLEARVLLAADLTGVVQSAALIDPAVPTNNASAVVQVQNIGNQRVNQSQVGVYASLDTTLDSSDLLLGTANTGQVNAGASKNVTVNLSLPSTLNPITYKLLAKVDNANAIAENSESNNVAIGGTINGTWKFGSVPGRTGNTTLTLKDADGTTVTFSLTGPGTGEVIRDGSQWDVKITGTTASSAVTIATNSGGNGRVTLNDIHVFGPLSAFLAATTDLTGTLAIDGPVNIPGLSPGTVTLGSIQGGTVAVPSVEALTIVGSTTNAKFYIGTTLGQDGQPGGTGANADTYGVGSLGLFTVTGAMSGTSVRVGINPVDGIYGNGNDTLNGGTSSSIGGIVIGGALSADTRFYAGSFPAQYLHGLTLKPTAGDFHFVSNFSGPSLTAALQQDTGSSATDKLTNNPTITGSLTDPQGIATFTAGFGAPPTFNILADRQTNGSFALSAARLEQINGGPLTDGPLTVTLRATDSAGNVTQITVPFTLDTQAPVLTVDLDPVSDSTPIGDQQTINATVTLVGQTEALAGVLLLETGATTQADASGNFSFTNVALAVGANSFTIRATDAAGNQRSETRTITRVVVGNSAPVLNAIGPQSVNEGQPLTFTATATDPDVPAQALTFSLTDGATGQVPLGASITAGGVFTWTPTEAQGPGNYTFDVVVSDGTLTDSETITVTVGEVNQAPTLTPIPNQTATVGQVLSFTAVGADADLPSNALTYSLEGLFSAGATIDPTTGGFTWTPTAAQVGGPHGFTVRVTDNGTPNLFAEQIVQVAVEPRPNQAPVLNPIGNQTIDEGQQLTFFANATDPDSPTTFTFSLDNGLSGQVPAGAVIAGGTGLFTWTPTEAQGPGSYTFDVVVTDNGTPALSDRETITVTVNEVSQAPTLQVIPNQTVIAGQLLTFTAVGLDPDIPANGLTYSLEGVVPAGATIDPTTGIFSWTPTNAQIGPQSLTVRVTDNDAPSLFAQQIVSIAVAPKPNQAPVLAPIVGHEVAFEGAETRFTLSATDPDSPTSVLRYSATGLPEGATLDALTGEFRWTPTEAQGGQGYQTTFTVTDEQGAQDSQLVSFIVMEVNNFAPMANPDSVPTPLDTPVTITAASLLANDTDADNQANGQEVAIVRVGAAQFGTLELSTVPDAVLGLKLDTIRYTPNAGFEGVETISYEINEVVDIQAGSPFPHATLDANVVGTLTIAVGNPQANQSPVLNVIGSQSVNAGQQLTFTATATDADLPAQQLTFSLQGTPPSGASISAGGVFTWTPAAGQEGAHSMTVRVTDDGVPALFDEETITVTVAADLAVSFQGLGDLPGGTIASFAGGVSADGNVVVGVGNYNNGFGGEEAFRWTSAEGTVGLGDLPGSIISSFANAVSADGAVVVGQSQSAAGQEAFIWTSSTGMVGLGDLAGGSVSSQATAVSADGSVVVGTADPGSGNFDHQAFRWTNSTGLVALGTLSNDASLGSEAFDLAADGTVVVGRSYFAVGSGYQAFRWTDGTGMVGLGGLPGAIVASEAYAVSADSTAVVGKALNTNGQEEAFRWTGGGGMVGLGMLPGDNFSVAFEVSGNGSLIVGVSGFIGGSTATSQPFIWDAVNGMRSLTSLLAADVGLGTSLAGWTLSNVTGVSADGRVIVGDGMNPTGQSEAWRAVLPAVLPVNEAPLLSPIGNQNVNEGVMLAFTASATDSSPFQSLTYSLQGTVPSGATIHPTTGVFTWTPTEAQGPGSYTFDVVVRDNSSMPLTDSETITVTVNDVDENPALNAIGNQSVNEASLLTFTATATAAIPNQALTFSLQGSVPAGAGINPTTGVFTWMPTEAQGPGTYQVTVRVSDANAPARFDEETITIAVAEVNQAPVLVPIADQTVMEGQPVSFTTSATDADVPANALTFTLEGTAPASATIDSVTGQFSWTPAAGEAGSYQFTVRVTDNGTPALFSEQTVNVTVLSNAASFQGLGDLPGGIFSSRPLGVSGNGAVVIGESEGVAGLESFRWTVGGGLQDLGTVVGTAAVGRAASFDGAVIVGDSDAGSFRWSVVDGFQTIVGNAALHSANAVTADGSVVVGKGQVNVFTPRGAFRWTAATGAVRLDSLAGYADAEALGVSADGNVIVGASYFGPSGEEAQAVRWVADGLGGFTAEALGDLPGGNFMSRAVAVSADGTLIFGLSESDRGQEAFIWTATGGMQALGDGTGDLRAMSADGSVIVGGSVIWDANNGIRSLSQVFTESGIAGFESWSMSALGVSADGRTIVGEGTNPDGNQEGWRVVLPVNTAPPVFNTVPAGLYPVQAGQAFTFTVSAFDPDGQLVQYRLLGNVPSGVNFLGGDFSWTPTQDDVGGHALVIRAYDSGVPSRYTDSPFTISVTS